MVNITKKQMDDATAAYYRATGTAPNRAGLRAALHTVKALDVYADLLSRLDEESEDELQEGL